MTPNPPMTEGEALAVLRELRELTWTCGMDSTHLVDHRETAALDAAIAALTAHTAASGGEVVCQLRMKEGNPGAAWFEVDERAYRDFAHPSSIYHYRTLYTAPPAAVPADALAGSSDDTRDAVRYRWLRRALLCAEEDPIDSILLEKEPETESEFDAAVDAALIPKGADHGQR